MEYYGQVLGQDAARQSEKALINQVVASSQKLVAAGKSADDGEGNMHDMADAYVSAIQAVMKAIPMDDTLITALRSVQALQSSLEARVHW